MCIKLHDNIQILLDWCKANKLTVNIDKTKYIIMI